MGKWTISISFLSTLPLTKKYLMFMCQEFPVHELWALFSIFMALILSCMSWFHFLHNLHCCLVFTLLYLLNLYHLLFPYCPLFLTLSSDLSDMMLVSSLWYFSSPISCTVYSSSSGSWISTLYSRDISSWTPLSCSYQYLSSS